MKFSKNIIPNISLFLIINTFFFHNPEVKSAENIKIVYSIFSRTIEVDSLKKFAEEGYAPNNLRRILRATGSSDEKIQDSFY